MTKEEETYRSASPHSADAYNTMVVTPRSARDLLWHLWLLGGHARACPRRQVKAICRLGLGAVLQQPPRAPRETRTPESSWPGAGPAEEVPNTPVLSGRGRSAFQSLPGLRWSVKYCRFASAHRGFRNDVWTVRRLYSGLPLWQCWI